jgi:hypothetical protein
VNARLAAMLTGAHAPAWRRRYGAEFRALLQDLPATPAIVASATTSALASQAPLLLAAGACALAMATVAVGPVASDRHAVTAHATHAPPAKPWSAGVACGPAVANVAPDGSVRC